MREINAINTKNDFLVQLEQIYFMTEYKNHEQKDLQVCQEPWCVQQFLY